MGITSETGDGWRRLGFYHELDREQRFWRFVGSRAGLGQLAHELRRCAGTEAGSEHGIRLGPHEDLVLYRWNRPGIDDQGIYGPPDALNSLAEIVEGNLGPPGSSTVIGPEYASDVEYRLRLEVREDDFDPAAVIPVPVVADVAEPANGDGAVELAHAADSVVSPSVPCYYYDPDAAFTETHGVVYLEGSHIVMQFQTTNVLFGKSGGAKEFRLSLEEISTVRFKRGFFGGAEMAIQTRDMMSVGEVPNAKLGLVRLKFKRANRELGETLAGMLEEALAQRDSWRP